MHLGKHFFISIISYIKYSFLFIKNFYSSNILY